MTTAVRRLLSPDYWVSRKQWSPRLNISTVDSQVISCGVRWMDGESDGSVCQCVCQSCCGHCVVSGEWTVSRTCPSVSACVSRTVATVWCPVSGRIVGQVRLSVCVSVMLWSLCGVRWVDGESDRSVCQCVRQSYCGHCVVSSEWTMSRRGPSVSACVSRAVATVWCPVSGRWVGQVRLAVRVSVVLWSLCGVRWVDGESDRSVWQWSEQRPRLVMRHAADTDVVDWQQKVSRSQTTRRRIACNSK